MLHPRLRPFAGPFIDARLLYHDFGGIAVASLIWPDRYIIRLGQLRGRM